MDLFVLKTDGKKFTSTNEKTLHLIFKKYNDDDDDEDDDDDDGPKHFC